jgi:hypothetical protein
MVTRGSSRRRSAQAAVDAHARIAGWLLIALAIPRLVRLLWPAVWVEDDFYLESAYLVSAGLRPYLDFVHPHPPLLEWIAGAYLRLFGASHRSLELLNEAAIYLTSVLTYALGRRAASERAAAMGAILYAFSSLVFRYHVYERECFVAPAVLLAAVASLDRALGALRQCTRIALALVFACAVKLTAGIACAVVLLYLAIGERRWARAIASGAAIVAGLAALTLICWRLYGFDFLFQTFLFHFLKGRDTALNIAIYPAQIVDVLGPLFVLGCAAIAMFPATRARGLALVLAMAAAAYVFFGLLSPTAWGHNYLEALPFIAIVSGIGLDRLVAAIRGDDETFRWARIAGAAAVMVVMLGWLTPLVNENWLHGSVYGFGFVPRQEIAEIAAALDDASAPGDDVVAPAFICFEANRRELIRYPETYGVYREALEVYERDGFRRAREHLGRTDFFVLIEQTAHFWMDPIHEAIRSRRVRAVIADSPVQLLPLVMLGPGFLAQSGYRPAMRTEHFTLWLREGGPAGGR